jgi:proline iminopeptidase
MSEAREGYINLSDGRVWYRVVGSGERPPLVLLHGGPGFPHDYLEPLGALADERPVIFYDQLGCGRSDRPDDTSLWHADRFVKELEQVRATLAPERVHILGHSWGSMLATDYALTRPRGLLSLILASPALSIKRWVEDAAECRKQLPANVQETLSRHEREGTIDSDEYRQAAEVFYRRHVCRLEPWPEAMARTLEGMGQAVYNTMWGPSEFHPTGNLLDYDRTARLNEIEAPVLFTCGRYDEATPEAAGWYQSLTPRSELAVFDGSAHMPHLEETDLYLEAVRDFLRRADRQVRA